MNAIVFDLDGTLIDSAPDIHAAANRMLADEGLQPLDYAAVQKFIGNGVPKLVERVMRRVGLADGEHARLVARFLHYYEAAPADKTTLYPGMVDTLTALKGAGYVLGVCTNKPLDPTLLILQAFDLEQLFDIVIGGDALPQRKPDPAPLQKAFADLGAKARIYVGDSEVDAETAERAGVPFVLFSQGYCKLPMDELTQVARFDAFPQLPDIIEAQFAT